MQTFTSLTDPKLIHMLQEGAVGVLPTDTVYGLVARAADQTAVGRLYGLKHREHKPGTLIAADTDQLVALGVKARYLKAVEQFWPGAVSVEIPHSIDYLNQATGRQAMRMPDDEPLRQLMSRVGALQTTSANAPDQPVAVNVRAAQDYFGESVDFYVDGGDLSDRPPSTIIRVVDDAIEIIRAGAVKIDENGRISK